MPTIYYAYYTPISDSISAISSQEHNLGHTLLLQELQDLFQLSFSPEELEQALKTDANGKPYLPDHPEICFNITHCDQLAACVFHDRPIGIDAEFPGYYPDVLVDRALSESEKDFLQSHNADLSENREWFYRLWTLKEAYVKKYGIGVDTDLTDFSFTFSNVQGTLSVSCSDPAILCYQTNLNHGHILSVCYEGPEPSVKLVSCSQQHVPPR